MVEQDNRRGRRSITAGRPDAPRKILVFHGYTGSPGEFEEMPEVLAKRLDALVHVPLMPGHGTRVEDLLSLSFGDFLRFAETETARFLGDSAEYAIGGNSFGSYMAAHVASTRTPRAFFLSATPYRLRFPFSLPGAELVASIKPLWKKYIVENERKAREHQFFYEYMPNLGLTLAKEGNRRMPQTLARISCPTLAMHELWDPLAYPRGSDDLLALTKSAKRETALFNEGWHGLFYGEVRHQSVKRLGDFLEESFDLAR